MIYRIDEVANAVANGETYVKVSFWPDQASRDAGDDPVLVNDFIMRLRQNASRIVTNRDGWYKRLSDGVFIDPTTLRDDDATVWERESVARDVQADARANIEAYWNRATANGWTGDHTGDKTKPFYANGQRVRQHRGVAVRRDLQDRNGATSTVRSIEGQEFDTTPSAQPSLLSRVMGVFR